MTGAKLQRLNLLKTLFRLQVVLTQVECLTIILVPALMSENQSLSTVFVLYSPVLFTLDCDSSLMLYSIVGKGWRV